MADVLSSFAFASASAGDATHAIGSTLLPSTTSQVVVGPSTSPILTVPAISNEPLITPSASITFSTIVGESTAVATSGNGQVFTTTVGFTTTLTPGAVITSAPIVAAKIGPIVGGAVGGIGGLLLLGLLLFFCWRRRRRDPFDGNFDPANITSVKGGGGTLPKIDLGEGGIMGDGGGEGLIDEDDGMGGRLGAGAGGGGIIMPYTFVPPAPVGGGGGGHPQMHQSSNVGGAGDGVGVAAAGYGNEKRAMTQQYAQRTLSPYIPSGSGSNHFASSTNRRYIKASGAGSPELKTSGFSYIGGSAAIVANPDDVPGQLSSFQQAYLRSGPGLHQQHCLSSSSSTPVPTKHSPMPLRAGTAVVVHDDGGRVVLCKGEGEGEAEALNAEIPPTYDSLPVDVRRVS